MSQRLPPTPELQERKLYQRRMVVALLLVILLALCLVARLAYLQLDKHHLYTTLSRENQLALEPVAPNRGLIYDRHGVLLAENQPIYNLELVPDKVPHLKKTLKQLSSLLTITPDDKKEFFKRLNHRRRFESIPIRMKLNPKEVAHFYVNQYRFPGVFIKAQLVRHYPLGKAMVSVLGYVGRINEKELDHVDRANYSATNYIGKVGIEKFMEDKLHGAVGYEQVETDANGRTVRVLKTTPPTPGSNLYLTIDSGLQIAAEKAMGKWRGSVVAIQPNSGQVLALVSNPTYDPNLFVTGISSKDYHLLANSPDQPLYNRAIRGQYPLASTIKPFLALEGLQSGTVTANETIFDPGFFRIPGNLHKYRCWKRQGHGQVDIHKAIVQSCDTYFYKLAYNMGIKPIDNIMHAFGFGKLTGVQMTEELPGLVATPEWKLRTKGDRWYTGDTVNASIGQGYMLATPLQLANATAILAERGKHYKPSLIDKIASPDGKVVRVKPVPEQRVNVATHFWTHVIRAMEDVVKSPRGTAYRRFGHKTPYSVAAKTGTAQLFSVAQDATYDAADVSLRLRDNSVFIAFAPVDNPQIAVAVIVENNPEAAVVARRVMDYYFKHPLKKTTSQLPLQEKIT